MSPIESDISEEPQDDASEIANAALEGAADYADEHGIEVEEIIVIARSQGRAVTALMSEEPPTPQMVAAALYSHLKAVMDSMGIDMSLYPMPPFMEN